MEEDNTYKTAYDIFGSERFLTRFKDNGKKKASERGELLRFFSEKTGWTIPRLALKLEGLKEQDLYYIKSIATAYEKEGKGAFAKAFFGSLKR